MLVSYQFHILQSTTAPVPREKVNSDKPCPPLNWDSLDGDFTFFFQSSIHKNPGVHNMKHGSIFGHFKSDFFGTPCNEGLKNITGYLFFFVSDTSGWYAQPLTLLVLMLLELILLLLLVLLVLVLLILMGY